MFKTPPPRVLSTESRRPVPWAAPRAPGTGPEPVDPNQDRIPLPVQKALLPKLLEEFLHLPGRKLRDLGNDPAPAADRDPGLRPLDPGLLNLLVQEVKQSELNQRLRQLTETVLQANHPLGKEGQEPLK
jgi:hypothetical protein